METHGGDVLPYRTDPEQLAGWIEARARGRASAQRRENDLAAKTLEGTVATAVALGLFQRDADQLTSAGQRFALASPAERRGLLRDALRAFPPFGGLLHAVAERPRRTVTDAQWIETWWATHGHGSSQSNRLEATAVFGRLVDHVGWGRYIPGRRGHPTRIEWSDGALGDLSPASEEPPLPAGPEALSPADDAPSEAGATLALPSEPAAPPIANGVAGPPAGYNRIVVPLRSGDVARLEVPLRLSRDEKRRLVELLDLLISEDPQRS